jgi:hypothetical protein
VTIAKSSPSFFFGLGFVPSDGAAAARGEIMTAESLDAIGAILES